MAAILACRLRAVVSHASAAWLWGLLDRPGGPVHITLLDSRGGNRAGIRAHQTDVLRPGRDVRRRGGIPLTSPARTILDLAASLAADELERVTAEAQARRLLRRGDLVEQLERHPGRRGRRPLRLLLDDERGPAFSRSRAERRLLALVRAARLPPPLLNSRLGPYEVDMLWPDQQVVVEFDSWTFHRSRRAFERDRARDAELQARGYRVIRVTWRQLTTEPETLIARIAAALAHGSSAGRVH